MPKPGPNPSDPLETLRASTRRTAGVAGVICTLAAGWALAPGGPAPWTAPTVRTGSEPAHAAAMPDTPRSMPVDAAAYQVALWVPPPEPPVEKAKPQPPALKLQLLGIHHEREAGREILRATLYDPDSDRVLIVADGQKLGAFTVTSVHAKGVNLSDGTLTRTLALDSGGKAISEGSSR